MKDHSSSVIANVRLLCGIVLFAVVGIVTSGSHFLVTSAGVWPLMSGFFFWLTIKLFYRSIHYVSPNQTIVLANSHPIFTPIAGVLLLSEPYSWAKFIGSILILVSIYFLNQKRPL